jgi:hypothetical protein
MHTWQEVHHYIEYKPYSGTVSTDEKRFLDLVNRLARAGGIALGQLHESLQRKAVIENKAFGSQWELGDWLTRNFINLSTHNMESPMTILKIRTILSSTRRLF